MPPDTTLVAADFNFVTWCTNNLKLSISETNKLVVDYSASGMDVAAKKI